MALSRVFPDHLRFSFREVVADVERLLLDLVVRYWADGVGVGLADVCSVDGGKAGQFSVHRSWSVRGLVVFRVLVAGQHTRGVSHVVFDGSSCALVAPEFWSAVAKLGELRAWSIRRVDLAVDDDSGRLSVPALRDAYAAGWLNRPRGGSRELRVLDSTVGDVANGWTVYVGRRSSQSMVRVYDKHAEVLSKCGPSSAALVPPGRVRVELELKSVKGFEVVPWSALVDRESWFGSDCELLASLCEGGSFRRLGSIARVEAEAQLFDKLRWCRHSYGPLIDALYWSLGGGADAAVVVVDLLRRAGDRPPVAGVAEVIGGGVPDRDFVSGG